MLAHMSQHNTSYGTVNPAGRKITDLRHGQRHDASEAKEARSAKDDRKGGAVCAAASPADACKHRWMAEYAGGAADTGSGLHIPDWPWPLGAWTCAGRTCPGKAGRCSERAGQKEGIDVSRPNRKTRRQQWATQRRQWREGMQSFRQQMRDGRFGEGGAFELFVVRPNTRPPCGFVSAMLRWRQAVADEDRPLCMCCDHEFRSGNDVPDAWTLAVPMHASPSMTILAALCERCARRSDDDITAAAFEHYRRMGMAKAVLQAGAA